MKQILALTLITLLLCTMLAPSVFAAEEPIVSAETAENVTDSSNFAVIESISIPEGTTPADGLENSVPISVQVISQVHTVTSAAITVTSAAITLTSAAITLTHFDEPDRTDAVAFSVGTTHEALSQWFSQVTMGFTGYDANGNPYDLNSGSWSLDAVNTATSGVYYAFTSPDLGTEYALADGVSLPRQLCAVSIQVLGEPDINCCVAGRGFLHFPWVLSAAQEEQLDEFKLWLRQDGEEWTRLSDGFLFISDGLQLSQRVLTYGSTYELKVTYPGGQTGVLTFQYEGALSILDYASGDRDGGDVSGGGSGTGTQPAPTPTQPSGNSNGAENQAASNDMPALGGTSSEADSTPLDSGTTSGEQQEPQDFSISGNESTPTAPQFPNDSQNNGNQNSNNHSQIQLPVTAQLENVILATETETESAETESAESESAEPVISDAFFSKEAERNSFEQESAVATESYSPTQTVISGLRLKDLCKEDESVVFGSGDLTVSIQSQLLLALNLSDTDTMAVTLTQPESNQIMLAVEVHGKSITQLSGTVLRLRYMPQSEHMNISIQNDVGEQITEVSYEANFLRFAADTAGTYTITERTSTQNTQKSKSPLIPVLGSLLLTAGGITRFRRKRHG